MTPTQDLYAGQYPPPPPLLPSDPSFDQINPVQPDEEMNLKEYLYAERREKLRKEQQQEAAALDCPSAVNKNRGVCCFGVSFFACFWTLFLLALFWAGIALIILAKHFIEITCQNESSLCGEVKYYGILYGGIVLACVSGLSVVWRIIHWLSRKKRN
ncbi:hypothetical protein BY458DRAFT_523057 [Sporodiniella umbellata]|nr:hypothetical protein BY458DRAFT_523057 [Sporodiniella umbellata]